MAVVGYSRGWLAGLTASMVVGLILSTLPHWWTGNTAWVADYDEIAFYLPLGAAAYRDHPLSLADPVTGGRTYYQSLPTVPGIAVAKAIGVGPWHLGLIWRALGGLGVGAGWFLFATCFFRPAIAFYAACVFLSDPGVMQGQMAYKLVNAAVAPLDTVSAYTTVNSASLPQWRILNPALSWPWWLLFLGLTARAVVVPTRGRIVAAGLAFGLLFYVYFYCWTTAALGVALAALFDKARRRTYSAVLVVGLALGTPALLASSDFRANFGDEWLHRTDKFLRVDRFEELLLPRVTLVLLAGGWTWVALRGRDVLWLAAMATAAILLMNNAVVTRLQIENFHWNYALGPPISMLVVIAVADLAGRLPPRVTRWLPVAAATLAVMTVGAGGWLYIRAVTGLPANLAHQQAVSDFRAQMAEVDLPRGAVAGTPDFQYFAAIQFDVRPLAGYTAVLSPITDAELDSRLGLNAIIEGRSREEYARRLAAALATDRWGPEARSEDARIATLTRRVAAYDTVSADLAAAIARFDVRTLGVPANIAFVPPPGWKLLSPGPTWAVWVRPQ